MTQRRKQLTFDIDTNIAKEILGEKNYTTAYANIKNFMKNEGWLHIEGSVYMSAKPLSTTQVAHLINSLKKEYPYLTKCIKNMHQSDVSKVHSLNFHFDYDGTAGKFAQKEQGGRDDIKPELALATAPNDSSYLSAASDSLKNKPVASKEKESVQSQKKPSAITDRIAQKKAEITQNKKESNSQQKNKTCETDKNKYLKRNTNNR